MSLDQLIRRCKKNDTKAQSDIYKLYSSKLFAICLKYCRSRAESEDVLHDAFMTIFKKISQFDNRGSFEGWLKRIVINTALQRYRGKGNLLNVVNENTIEDVTVEVEDYDYDLDFLLKTIQELPDRYRLVFNLFTLDEHTHKEIAEMLNIKIGTSKSNLARARMILKEKIELYRSNYRSQLSQ